MHTAISVHQIDSDSDTRSGWVDQSCPNQGIYLFGGQNEYGKMQNDLWLIEPLYQQNEKLLTSPNYEFVADKPVLSMTMHSITDFSG